MIFYFVFGICTLGLVFLEWIDRNKEEKYFSLEKTCLWFTYSILSFFRFLDSMMNPGRFAYEFIAWAMWLVFIAAVLSFRCYKRTSRKNHDFLLKNYVPLGVIGFLLIEQYNYYSLIVLLHYLLVIYRGKKSFWNN